MDRLQYIYYPLLLILLFAGARAVRRGEWNEDVLSLEQTKAFLGFASIVIIFHHASQKTCAPWLNPRYIRHGLDAFVYVGYLCVAAFFFCSGYGMRTACEKEGFFKGYFKKRLLPIICPAIVIWLVFFVTERVRGVKIDPPLWINVYDYIWFIPAILYLYVCFYISFHLVKADRLNMPVLWAGTILYIILAVLFSPGTWWFNSVHLFAVGAGFAGKKERRLERLKKAWILKTAVFVLLTGLFFTAANYYPMIMEKLHKPYNGKVHMLLEGSCQMISAYTFVFVLILLGLKIRIGNRALSLLGKITLKLYLLHPYFVQIFAFAFIKEGNRPVFYIKDPFLYVLAILACSLPLALLEERLFSMMFRRSARSREE